MTKNSDGSFTIKTREAGPEAAAFGAGFAPEFGDGSSFGGLETGVEVTSGSIVTYGIYSCVMAILDTIPMRRSGAITAAEQREIVLDRTWSATKGCVPTVIILGAVLALCPWMAPIVGLAGWVGFSVMSVRLTRSVMDAMSVEQKASIRDKAKEVGVEIPGISADDEPLPTTA